MKKWSWPYFILISLPFVVFIVLAFGLKAAGTPIWVKIGVDCVSFDLRDGVFPFIAEDKMSNVLERR